MKYVFDEVELEDMRRKLINAVDEYVSYCLMKNEHNKSFNEMLTERMDYLRQLRTIERSW